MWYVVPLLQKTGKNASKNWSFGRTDGNFHEFPRFSREFPLTFYSPMFLPDLACVWVRSSIKSITSYKAVPYCAILYYKWIGKRGFHSGTTSTLLPRKYATTEIKSAFVMGFRTRTSCAKAEDPGKVLDGGGGGKQ